MSSPLWRSAAAAAAGRQLSRPPSAATITAIRRHPHSMASSSSSPETMEGAWPIRWAFWFVVGTLALLPLPGYAKSHRVTAKVHEDEIRSMREEIRSLQASNAELQDLLEPYLKRRRARNQGN